MATTAVSVLEQRLSEQVSDHLVVKRGQEIGLKSTHKFVFYPCIDCGEKRWVLLKKNKPASKKCFKCYRQKRAGVDNPNWGDGKYKDAKAGYIYTKIYSNDFFFPMADKRGYIQEHRLIMAKHLNRCLLSWEIIHHKNGIKDDNRLENLKLLSSKLQHLPDTLLKSKVKRQDERIKRLEARVTLLEAENIVLRGQYGNDRCLRP